MKNIKYWKICLYCLLLIFCFCSCRQENRLTELFARVQSKMESNPTEALTLLDSIHNPDNMNRNDYMQYIVFRMQAKFMSGQSLKNDPLIFDATRYFDSKNNAYHSALAHYYSACAYYENKISEKELEHFMLANHYARKAENNLLIGKSFHSIGNLYYEKNLLDSARINYKQALVYYAKDENRDKYKLQTLRFLGLSHYIDNHLDSANICFKEGMQLAKQIEKNDYQATFTHLTGMVFYKQGNYADAVDYLHSALSGSSNPDELPRIYMGLLKLYNKTNQLDSARHYSDLLKGYLNEKVYLYTLKESYAAISEYYKKSDDYKEALYYNNLYDETTQKISESNNSRKLAEADRKYKAALQQQEIDGMRMRNYLYLLGGISLILIILVTVYFRNRTLRLKRQRTIERNRLLEQQALVQEKLLEHQDDSLTYMQGIYRNIVTEWVEIDKKVKSLVKEFGVKEEPELYVKMKQMIESFKQNTNHQLVGQAREHLLKQPYGENAVSLLKEKDLLLFMLYYCGYKRHDVAILLGVNPHKDNMSFRKLDLRSKLLKAGMQHEDIEKILFSEENVN